VRIGVMLRTFDEKGGVAVYSRNLIRTLIELDNENEYDLFYRSDAHLGSFVGRENVVEHVLSAPGKALWDQWAVPRACREHGVDVLLHPKFTVPFFAGVPTVMVVHGADWFLPQAARFYTRSDRLYMHVFMPLYLRRASFVISVSKLTTEDFARIFPYCEHKIETVYFGPARHFHRVTDEEQLAVVRRKYSLPDRFILTLQKMAGDERKNVRGVFEGYARIHGSVPHKLVVGGLGCERFRDDYGLPTSGWGRDVIFPGYLEQTDLPAIYSLSDLFLYPSNQEAFPIPLTEAMACGVPIVTSRANGLEELAGDAAILVNPRDSDEIGAAAHRVLTEPDLRVRLAEEAFRRARQFSWDQCARRTLEILVATAAGHASQSQSRQQV
jgi:glycosyltransferase involved in cell wall biosynthesis